MVFVFLCFIYSTILSVPNCDFKNYEQKHKVIKKMEDNLTV